MGNNHSAEASPGTTRKHWLKETTEPSGGEAWKDCRKGREEVDERVKWASDFDEHKQKLVGCIVSPCRSNILVYRLMFITYLFESLTGTFNSTPRKVHHPHIGTLGHWMSAVWTSGDRENTGCEDVGNRG